MNSTTPYLVRAINEWILDNQCTPYLILDVNTPGVSVPMEHAKEGQIVLNIGPMAVRDLVIDNEQVSFTSRFGGVAHTIYAPFEAVLGIIAKENGEGMWFPREKPDPDGPSQSPDDSPKVDSPKDGSPKKGPPNLKVIK